MNIDTYTYLLAHPAQIGKDQLEKLSQIIDAFPYFQSARALQLKGLKNEQSFRYNDALKLTAALTTDRDVLFDYITSETFSQNEISSIIQQQSETVKELEVEHEDLSAHVSLEIEKQMKAEMRKAEAILDPSLFEKKIASVVAQIDQSEEEKETIDPKEEISLNTPLEFTSEDTYSFAEWLKLTKAAPIERTQETQISEEKQQNEERARKFELIDRFIQQQPKLKPGPVSQANKDLAQPYTQASEALMTETLAKVYVQQRNYEKAIQAYKILILKNPEKSGFFADQIRAIKKLIKTEEQ